MPSNTVAQFADELKMPANVLLEQLRGAGVDIKSVDDPVTEADKAKLFESLRRARGASESQKITVTRRQTSEIRQADGSGRSRTIPVEVRKKRVFVKRDTSELAAEAARAAEQARAGAQAEDALEKQAAEAVAPEAPAPVAAAPAPAPAPAEVKAPVEASKPAAPETPVVEKAAVESPKEEPAAPVEVKQEAEAPAPKEAAPAPAAESAPAAPAAETEAPVAEAPAKTEAPAAEPAAPARGKGRQATAGTAAVKPAAGRN